MTNEFSHLDNHDRPQMVDVSAKKPQKRTARAEGFITLASATIEKITASEIRKGNVIAVAELAGIQAAKKTADLIPLCHPLPLTHAGVKITVFSPTMLRVEAEASCVGVTGVEMEALTAASVALLTIYDMCKAVDKNMLLGEIRLIEKVKQDL